MLRHAPLPIFPKRLPLPTAREPSRQDCALEEGTIEQSARPGASLKVSGDVGHVQLRTTVVTHLGRIQNEPEDAAIRDLTEHDRSR